MSPRNPDPEDEMMGLREQQRVRKAAARRERGLPPPSPLAREIAAALWFYRELQGLTQQQLAEILGMKQSQIARLESGFVNPSLETLTRLSARLGIDFNIELKSGALRVGWSRG